MLTPSEIYTNFDTLAHTHPQAGQFGLDLMEAVGAPRATITKLKDAAQSGAFVWTRMLRFEAVTLGQADTALATMKADAAAASRAKRPRLLVAYDGEGIAAHDTKVGDDLHVGVDALPVEADFFFPLGGHERYIPAPERLADVRATKHISRFFDAVRDANPSWKAAADRHALNLFMIRVLFCLFSEDVGIFEQDLFNAALKHTKADGSDLARFLEGAFVHMNTKPEDRPAATYGWSKLPFVNGGLFEEISATPSLDGRCRKHLLDCCKLNWRTINPDIFGSMLQAVVSVEMRGELGMHYTSPTNILKVLDPIMLDGLRADLEKAGTNRKRLKELLDRLAVVRVFDPACGSGNFLILAYKELRALEMEILQRLGEFPLEHTRIKLDNFFGIELEDFACQTARLGLWVAEYQMDEVYKQRVSQVPSFLPLKDAGHIVCANAATIDWLTVCPPNAAMETFVVGNPPFKGSKHRSDEQTEDMHAALPGELKAYSELDYVAIWFVQGTLYSESTRSPFAFVSTNSIVQGTSVSTLWPRVLRNLEIGFAHRSFRWSNLATKKAAVTCVVVGVTPRGNTPKRLYDGDTVREVGMIGPYLAPNINTIVRPHRTPLSSDLQVLAFGNMPLDGRKERALRMSGVERARIVKSHPEATPFLRPIFGSDELLKGKDLWCVWVRPDQASNATAIGPLAAAFERVRKLRLAGGADMRKMADQPFSFREQYESASHTIMVPAISSENRHWLPIDIKTSEAIASNKIYSLYDGDIWQAAVLSSRLHRLWFETVGGRIKEDPSYSNELVWNTFPLPPLSDRRKAELEEHWWEIDRARKEAGFGRTLGDLYSHKAMPDDLRRAHEDLDKTMEAIFGSRAYRSDADRIEHMLQLYERAEAAAKTSKKKGAAA